MSVIRRKPEWTQLTCNCDDEPVRLSPGQSCGSCGAVYPGSAAATAQEAVGTLRELVAAFEDTYASSVSGSGRYESTIPRLSKAMDAARAIIGGNSGS